MKEQIIIVTGSSDGIGKETALQLLKDGAIVILACRHENKTIKIINSINNEGEKKEQYL
jgi:retinol dehydrogenase-12